ncbi:nucleoprotein TPR-like [Elysia marginata]|uniref:Nucleoprotein TPR-like n=1 Tax=Elysia marginata TaxID=1093978 RepID=A0AAV4K059_9GAST|nr:nucleoprotein TPR-like [Elysia marginata]
MKEAEKWLERLFPNSAYPLTRVWGRAGHVVETAQRLTGQALVDFLNTKVNFEFISESLQAVGVTRALDSDQFQQIILTNAVVCDLSNYMINEGYCYSALLEKLSLLSSQPLDCTVDKLRKRVMSAEKQRKKLVSNRKRNPEGLQTWLNAPFLALDCKESHTPSTSSGTSARTPVLANFVPPAASTPVNNDSSSFTSGQNAQYIRKLQQELVDSKERQDVLFIEVQAVKEMYESSQDAYKKLRAEHEALLAQFKATKAQNKELSQEKAERDDKMKEVMVSRLYKKCKRLEEENDRLKAAALELEDMKKENEELKREKTNLQKYLSQAKKKRDHYKYDAQRVDHEAIKLIVKDSTPDVSLREGNRFSNAIRRTVIALISTCNVSPSQCSKCIQAVARELFGINWTLKDLPSEQTLRDITDEAHVLSKLLMAEKLQQSKFILHLDGTSRDKRKIVGHQVTLENGDTLSLGYVDVATEDAATLLDVTISILRELGEIYAPAEQDLVFRDILRKLKGTMTDRASVMKKFSKDLETACKSSFDCSEDLVFLHCNAHFLLGLSSQIDAALKAVESELDKKLGRDAFSKFAKYKSAETATSRFVRTACAILGPRGDQKSGCRLEWLAFCEERDVSSKLPSYRSNRFNCFFEGAARLIQNLSTIQEFLSGSFLGHDNLLIDSVRKDSNDRNLMILVSTLGFTYLHFTGPYWQFVRSNAKLELFPPYVQDLHTSFNACAEDPPQCLLSSFEPSLLPQKFNVPDHDALKHSLETFSATFSSEETQIFATVSCAVMKAASEVLCRQLHDFLKGGRLEKIPDNLHSCPLTNLVGENAFGDFDFQKNKHRHASLFHHSSLHMTKHNKVTAWLDCKTADQTESLMSAARKSAKALRKKHRLREQDVIKAVRKKLIENAAAQQELDMKAAATKKKLIEDVLGHGGPCRSPSDVKNLQSSLSQKDLLTALKDEIRYQKAILGAPGVLKLSKPVNELAADLCVHLGGQDKENFVQDQESSDSESLISEDDRDDSTTEPWQGEFKFQAGNSWVAVYYDEQFYVGQVINIISADSAEIKFLEQTKANEEYFRWPRADDIAVVDAKFVFAWNFDVAPVSNNCRLWMTDCFAALNVSYSRIKKAQKYFDIEKQLITSNGKLESETAQKKSLEDKLEESEKKLQETTRDNQELREKKDSFQSLEYEYKRTIHELETEKRELGTVATKRRKDIECLNAEVEELTKKVTAANNEKCEAQVKLGELQSVEVSREYREKRLEAEKAQLEQQVTWFNEQLTEKTSQLSTVRKEKTSNVLELQSALEEKTQELTHQKSVVDNLKESLEKQGERLEAAFQKLKEEREGQVQIEEQFRQELAVQKRLVTLYKAAADENDQQVTELSGAMEELRKMLKDSTEAYTELEAKNAEETRKFEVTLQGKDESLSKLEDELKNANELIAALKKSSIPLSDSAVESLSPSAAATSRLLKSGMTLTKVQRLLKENEELRGGRVVAEDLDVSSSEVSSSTIITEKLVTFRSIEELQKQNEKLIGVCRELSEKREQEETEATTQKMQEMKEQLEFALSELDNLKDARARQAEMVESIVRQRDMYRVLLQQGGSLTEVPSIPQVTSTPRQPAQASSSPAKVNESQADVEAKKKELEAARDALKELKAEFDTYKKDKAENERLLNESSEKTKQSLSDMRVSNTKLTTQLNFATERYKIVQDNVAGYKKEINLLQERNHLQASNIHKHESAIAHLKEELMGAKESVARWQVQVENLKKEKELLKNAESRLMMELESIRREHSTQAMLTASLQAIQDIVKNVHLELKHEKEKAATIQARADNARLELETAKQELSTCEAKLAAAETKLENLATSQANREEDAADVLSRVETEAVKDLKNQIAEQTILIKSLRQQLEAAKKHANQFKTIADTAEQSMKEQTEASKEVEKACEKKIQDIQAERETLEKRVELMEQDLVAANTENARLTTESSSLAQDKYQRELMLHAADVEALATVRKQLEDIQEHLQQTQEETSMYEKQLADAKVCNT